MSSQFINGTTYYISTTKSAAVPISALSNAAPPVATSATPPADGSIVVVKSGWPELNESVSRTDGATANTFELEGRDTTDTTDYPAGAGVGTYETVGDWVGLSQVRDVVMSGGEQNNFTFQYVEDKNSRQRSKPTFKNAMELAITLDYDRTLPWYNALIEADRRGQPIVLREVLPSGEIVLYYGTIAFNKVPTKTVNENMTVLATFYMQTDPITYDAVP